MKDRTHYAQMDTESLKRMLRQVEDRIQRADTNEAWVTDAFQQQEIEAALQDRKEPQ